MEKLRDYLRISEAAEYLFHLLEGLPPKDRLVLTLLYFEGCDTYEIADRMGCTSSQVALAWLIQMPGTVIPIIGCSKISQLEDNLGALDVNLSDEDWQKLDKAGREVWEVLGPDATMWGWKPE